MWRAPPQPIPRSNCLWRNADGGRGVLMRITAAGLDALGIEAG